MITNEQAVTHIMAYYQQANRMRLLQTEMTPLFHQPIAVIEKKKPGSSPLFIVTPNWNWYI